ncbi:hypothetical protein PHLGIDRAFT_326383 [Phlebiopsis gigantea 11061_1 CR5-6]|uniref:Uncharacterized protein n=1 Tax=Phlebiopsis gigantea (strain 11061_1 CR5-6) TaxID=745531 RepID=A0A0C3NBI8_PHLG1|nr:hypothetical protein PHLGIDRAFT_326383 [Phlebiopsis gigantea 11061_1 CR5-6]
MTQANQTSVASSHAPQQPAALTAQQRGGPAQHMPDALSIRNARMEGDGYEESDKEETISSVPEDRDSTADVDGDVWMTPVMRAQAMVPPRLPSDYGDYLDTPLTPPANIPTPPADTPTPASVLNSTNAEASGSVPRQEQENLNVPGSIPTHAKAKGKRPRLESRSPSPPTQDLQAQTYLILQSALERIERKTDEESKRRMRWEVEEAENRRAWEKRMAEQMASQRQSAAVARLKKPAEAKAAKKRSRLAARAAKLGVRVDGYESDNENNNEPELAAAPLSTALLKRYVKRHLHKYMEYETGLEKLGDGLRARYPPLTPAELKAFDERRFMPVMAAGKFRFDFSLNPTHLFNQTARDAFSDSFLQVVQNGGYSNEGSIPGRHRTKEAVGHTLMTHFEYLQKEYRKHRTEDQLDEIHERSSVNSRKKTLLESRVAIVLYLHYQKHVSLLASLSPCHMSGDEEEKEKPPHPPTWRIVPARWRSREFTEFLRVLDLEWREKWSAPIHTRKTSGNPPRNRREVYGSRSEEGIAPTGLPRNCYDAEWLEALHPTARRGLNIKEGELYDFSLPS